MDEIGLERLSDEERAALTALPMTRIPDAALEERTVQALYERGLLWTPAPQNSAWPWRWLVAAAAAIVMFAGGVFVGQRLEASEVGNAMTLAADADAPLGIADIQRASDQFVAVAARADELSETADPEVQAQMRDILVDGLRAYAGVVARIAPDEPIASEIFRGTAQIETDPDRGTEMTAVRGEHVLWF